MYPDQLASSEDLHCFQISIDSAYIWFDTVFYRVNSLYM